MAFNHGGCFIYCRPSTFMKMFPNFIKTFYTLLLTGPNLPPCERSSEIIVIMMMVMMMVMMMTALMMMVMMMRKWVL